MILEKFVRKCVISRYKHYKNKSRQLEEENQKLYKSLTNVQIQLTLYRSKEKKSGLEKINNP